LAPVGVALRRRGGILLAAALAGLLGFGFIVPAPQELEYALQDAETSSPPRVAKIAARGPAVARYDAANDTTVLAFQCAHQSCYTAVRVKGHLDGADREGTVLLDLPGWSRPLGFEPLDPPLLVSDYGGQEPRAVDRVVDVTFEREGLGLPVAAYALLLAAAGSGLALLRGRPDTAGPFALAAMAGEAPGLLLAAGGALLLFFAVPFVLLPLGLGAAGLLRAARRRPRLWAAGWGLLAFLAALLAAGVAFAPYFTHPPTA
jgi:hypothetical protein